MPLVAGHDDACRIERLTVHAQQLTCGGPHFGRTFQARDQLFQKIRFENGIRIEEQNVRSGVIPRESIVSGGKPGVHFGSNHVGIHIAQQIQRSVRRRIVEYPDPEIAERLSMEAFQTAKDVVRAVVGDDLD